MNEFFHVAGITVPLMCKGLKVTFSVSVLSILFSSFIGIMLACMCVSENRIADCIARIYIKIFRCTPFMVQVYLIYYGLPELGIQVSAFWTGVIILSMYTAAYAAVILESGIRAIPKGQSEAGLAMGMTKPQILGRILFPQTIGIITPALTGQFIQTIKDSSILSVITVAEMTMMTKEAIGITFSSLNVYVIAALFYWALNLIIEFFSKYIERKHRRNII